MNCLSVQRWIAAHTGKRLFCALLLTAVACAAIARDVFAAPADSRRTPAPKAVARPLASTTSLVINTPPPTTNQRATPTKPPPAKPPKPTSPPTVRPKATPTPTPAPVSRPYAYPYVPPLSPEEARALVLACIKILTIKDPATHVSRCRKVSEIVGKTITYLTILDQRHSTLASYKWHFIDQEKVSDGIDSDEINVRPVIPRVSAISFAAHYGDVYLYSVVVYDDEGTSTLFKLRRLVEYKFPREEICYLMFPTTLKKVVIRYEVRRRRSRTPRLSIFAGVAGEEEYLKHALGYLRDARRKTRQAIADRANAGKHLGPACKNLQQAADRVKQFRMKQRY